MPTLRVANNVRKLIESGSDELAKLNARNSTDTQS